MTVASDKLSMLVAEFAEQHAKFEEKGNHSAGVRARKKLMEIRKASAEIKAEMLEKEAADEKANA